LTDFITLVQASYTSMLRGGIVQKVASGTDDERR
jgi:hypothetical protein